MRLVLDTNVVASAMLWGGSPMLLFEDAECGSDEDLRLQFEAMNQLSTEEKAVARDVLEGLLLKHSARKWGGISTTKSATKKKASSAHRTGTRG